MKRKTKLILITILYVTIMTSIISCVHCEKTKPKDVLFEDCVRRDLSWMDNHYGNDYRWYSCGIEMKAYLDEENDGTIQDLTNIFMVRSDPGNSYDTNAILIHHDATGRQCYNFKSVWVEEDVFIKKDLVQVTFRESLLKAQSADTKPHTKHVVLRKQLGPNDSNPQYIYGNNHGLLFIDATSSNISTDSPAFRNTGFDTWLGEWPE